jgi:hypothetical protein
MSQAIVKSKRQKARSNCSGNCGSNNCDGYCDSNCDTDFDTLCMKKYLYCGTYAGGDLCGTYPNPTVRAIRGIEICNVLPQMGQVLVFDGECYKPSFGTNTTPTGNAGGDLGGTYPNPKVIQLQGYPVAPGSPGGGGQVLTWNGSIWIPQLPSFFSSIPAGGDLSGNYPNPSVSRIQGQPVAAGTPLNGQVLTWNSSLSRWEPSSPMTGPAGGDLDGNYPNPTVRRLQTYPISNAAPTINQILQWNGSLWTPTNLPTGPSGAAAGDLGGNYPAPTVVALQGRPISTNLPVSGQVLEWNGSTWIPTTLSVSGSASGDVTGAYSGPLSVVKIQGRPVASTLPNSNEVLAWNGGSWAPAVLSASGVAGGDLFGTYPNPTVIKLQNYPISNAVPTINQVLQWTGSQWAPAFVSAAASGPAGGDLTGSYPNPTVSRINGISVSNFPSVNGYVLTLVGGNWVPQPSNALPAATTNGQIPVNIGGVWTVSPGSPPSFGQVLAWNNSTWAPASVTLTGAASGDLSGNYPNPTVSRLLNQLITGPATTNGQFLSFNGASWTPTTAPTVIGQVPQWNGTNWIPTTLSSISQLPRVVYNSTNIIVPSTSSARIIYNPGNGFRGIYRYNFYAVFDSPPPNTGLKITISLDWYDYTISPFLRNNILEGFSPNLESNFSFTYTINADPALSIGPNGNISFVLTNNSAGSNNITVYTTIELLALLP